MSTDRTSGQEVAKLVRNETAVLTKVLRNSERRFGLLNRHYLTVNKEKTVRNKWQSSGQVIISVSSNSSIQAKVFKSTTTFPTDTLLLLLPSLIPLRIILLLPHHHHYLPLRRRLSSAMCHTVWYTVTDVSEELPASIIRVHTRCR